MSAIPVRLTPVTTIHTLELGGIVLKEMREESRWEGFMKLTGLLDGKPVTAIIFSEQNGGFSGIFSNLFNEITGDRSMSAKLVIGSQNLIEAIEDAKNSRTVKPQ